MSEPTPTRGPTPRSRFISNPTNVRQHGELIELPSFQRAVEVALAEFQRGAVALASEHNLNEQGAEQAAAATFHMLQGAQYFVDVLYRLADPPSKLPDKKPSGDNLEHHN